MTRALYAYLFDTLSLVDPLVAILDNTDGIRRADHLKPRHDLDSAATDGTAAERSFTNILTMGRLTRAPVPGYESRPLQFQTVTFAPWIRDESQSGGDLVLEDVIDWVMKGLVWIPSGGHPPNQVCSPGDPGIIVLNARDDGSDTEPVFDHAFQAWTKLFRLRFLVSLATCGPVSAACNPCQEATT